MPGRLTALFTLLILSLNLPDMNAEDPRMDWFKNPFNQNSAHHRPIGTGAIYADVNHPAVLDWLQGSRIAINVGDRPHGLFMGEADERGPVLTANPRRETGHSGLPTDMRFPPGGVEIDFPAYFDGNITIFDRTINRFNHLRVYAWNHGEPLALQYRQYDPDSVGHGARLMERTGTSASGVAAPFGILRGWEVEREGHPIGHALQLSLPGQSTKSRHVMLGREVWWPAVSMDGWVYHREEHNTGNIPYGSLWAIPPVEKGGPNLDSLNLSEKGRRLAECLRDYGMYVVDNAAGPAIRADQNFSPEVREELMEQTRKFYPYIRLVLNSVPEEGKVLFNVGDAPYNPTGGPNRQIIPGEFPAGGGEPLAPVYAIDALKP